MLEIIVHLMVNTSSFSFGTANLVTAMNRGRWDAILKWRLHFFRHRVS
jgi:hypothetical protein